MATLRDLGIAWLTVALGLGTFAVTAEIKSDAAGAAKPATCKVEKGPIKVTATMKGIVESARMAEVSIAPEAWTMPLVVEKVVDHGTMVKTGDVLVEFEHDKIDEAIDDLRVERALSEAAVKHAEDELPILERFLPIDLAAALRTKQQADEDLTRFLDTDRPLSEQSAKFQLKSSEFSLETARDELAQLEKMYRSKDLTEETEQLILKRHRFQVEAAEFRLKMSENHRDQTMKVDLPRRELAARENAAKQSLALEKARSLLPLELSQKRYTRDKLRHDCEKADERLAKLEHDRKAMIVRAPEDGIAFHGRPVRGQWTSAAPALQKGSAMPPRQTILTVVAARPVFVRAIVEEKDLHDLRPGLAGKAVPAGYPDLKLPAKLTSITAVPVTPGNFEARVEVELDTTADAIMPGMACTVAIVSYRKDDAFVVPATAVFSDDADEDMHYVYLARQGEKPERRTVRVGRSSGGKTEILAGVKEGDEILTSKP